MPADKFLIVKTKEVIKSNFKKYCRGQGYSMQQGLNYLMETSARKNFPIKTRMRMKAKV